MKCIPGDLKAEAGDRHWRGHLDPSSEKIRKEAPFFWRIEVINKECHLHKSTSFATNHGGFFRSMG